MIAQSTMRRHRRKELLHMMQFYANLACESHGTNRAHLVNVFTAAAKLLRITGTSRARVEELIKIIGACSTDLGGIHWNVDKGELYVNATIALEELEDHMVWGDGVSVKEIGA